MKSIRLSKLMFVFATLAAVIAIWGQGCAKPVEEGSSTNNGGGYGGLVLDANGQYGSTNSQTDPGQGDDIASYLYRAGDSTSTVCGSYLSGWQNVGHSILDILVVKTSGALRYYDHPCSTTPVAIGRADLRQVQYNKEMALYDDKIFVATVDPVATIGELKFSKVFCYSSSSVAALDQGVDVHISVDGSNFKADVWVGRVVSNRGYSFRSRPFGVSYSASSSERFFATGFDLRVNHSTGLRATGTLSADLGSGTERIDVTCVQHRP